MTSICGAIQDDIDEYIFLCKKYKEEVIYVEDAYGKSFPDCYSIHASKLIDRHREDIKNGQR